MKGRILKIIAIIIFFLSINNKQYAQMSIILGTQQSQSTTAGASPYTAESKSRRVQYVYTASEINAQLIAIGATTGIPREVKGIAWDIADLVLNGNALNNYVVKMGNTSASDMTNENYDANTVCFDGTYQPTTTGWKEINFTNNFTWNGTSNIVVEVCFYNTWNHNSGKVWLYNTSVPNQRRGTTSNYYSACNYSLQWGAAESGKPRIQIIFNCPNMSVDAGSDQSICNTTPENTAIMSATIPGVGETGLWSVVSGTGTFSNPTSYNSSVICGKGTNVYRWTITTSNGCSYYDDVVVVNNTPDEPNAGPDASTCEPNYYLNANEPVFGTGCWSVVSGSGVFSNSQLYNTLVSDLTGSDNGSANVFRWTITQNGCSKSDDVTITYYYPPNAEVSSSTLSGCYNTDVLQLNGNDPSSLSPPATGQWSVVMGTGTFTNSTLYNTTVTNVGIGQNIYRWTLTRNGCINSANVVVNNLSPSQAYAGSDVIISTNTFVLNGNTPYQGTGTWSVIPSGPTFSNPNLPNATVSNIADNTTYQFIWTIQNSTCPPTIDTVIVTNIPTIKGFVINDNLTNNGTFIQTDEDEYFNMIGNNKYIYGGDASDNTYTDAKLRVVGNIIYDGVIDNGKFSKTLVDNTKTFTIKGNRTYKNHDFQNYGTTYINLNSIWENSGNWTNNSTVSCHATSIVKFNGSATQEVKTNSDAAGTTNQFGNVHINNTSTPSATNGVKLIDNPMSLNVNSILTLIDGIIITNGQKVIINNPNNNAIVYSGSGETESWIYTTSETSVLRRYIANANNGNYIFPVGSDVQWNRAVITNNSLPNNNSFYIDCYFKKRPTNPNLGFPTNLIENGFTYERVVAENGAEGVWGFVPSNPSNIDGTYDLYLYFNGFSGLSDNQFNIVSRVEDLGNGTNWTLCSGIPHQSLVSQGYAWRTGCTTFSEKGIATTNQPLPVQLLYFKASCSNNNLVKLEWATGSEVNNSHFILEKSTDGNIYKYVATIVGSGFSSTPSYYSYEDIYESNYTYYKLKQFDYNGSNIEYSPVAVYCNNDNTQQLEIFAISENNNQQTIQIHIKNNSDNELFYNCYVYNNIGQLVKQKSDFLTKGITTISINKTDMPFGIYYLHFVSENYSFSKKIILR